MVGHTAVTREAGTDLSPRTLIATPAHDCTARFAQPRITPEVWNCTKDRPCASAPMLYDGTANARDAPSINTLPTTTRSCIRSNRHS
jgi:hypothetical protein